ncbi:MAG: radical SAM protein [Candidatus Cloacimonetes bacterium]|nr:radical SAM protein [Candidatus Cloacimonadota bacterium]
MPMNYTFSLTYHCNSHCKTCNIYERKTTDMTLDEWRKVFKNLGRSPFWITISGGEPFLRKDIADICIEASRMCRPAIINIPTNGIMSERIVAAVKRIVEGCPKTQIVINLSIDGIGEQHNQIRGVPRNYEKAIRTFNQLRKLDAPNLSLGIHTVISRFNVGNFAAIANKLLSLKPDSYITEIAEEREELLTVGKNISPQMIEYRSAVDWLVHRIKNERFKGQARITQAFRVEYYNLVKRILRDQTQVIPCYAGITSAQIAPDGEVWACCIKAKSFGNLRSFMYRFKPIWWSHAMKAERRLIRNKECYCPLANAGYTNMLMDMPTLMRVFWRSYIRWWR